MTIPATASTTPSVIDSLVPTHYEWQQPLEISEGHVLNSQHRQGLSWTLEELEVIIDTLRAPMPITKQRTAALAQFLRRSPSAVTSRARTLVPAGTKQPLQTLHAVLQRNPDYDWKAVLSSHDEPLIDYSTLQAIAALDPEQPRSIDTVAELTEISTKRAASLLRRVHQGSFVGR